jgi:predicted nucleic acid-binding protein
LASYYLETSALVKLYVRESGTDRMLGLTVPDSGNRLIILSLAQVEFRSAIRRRENAGEIPTRVAVQLVQTFRRHLDTRFTTQPLTQFIIDLASELADRYALRAFDAVQLAGYTALRSSSGVDEPIFVCADQALLSAAKQEQLAVLDPCVSP